MKKEVVLSTVTLLLASCAPTMQKPTEATSPPTCQAVTKPQVEAFFTRWNDSLLTLDPHKVTANYLDDAVLLPTVSNVPRTNHEQINEYFEHFLQKGPSGVINKRVIRLNCNVAIDDGVYTFTFKDASKVTARYTFVYEYNNGKWLIAAHHSSAMPKSLTEEPWDK